MPTPALTPTIEPHKVGIVEPLDYEVVESYVKEDTIIHTSSITIEGIGESEETWEEPIFVAYVTVRNVDTVAGSFVVTFFFDRPLDSLFLNTTLEMAPNETLTASCPAYILGGWSYAITPSTKTVTKIVYD